MTWPTVAVNTTNVDAGTDSPASARSDILDALTKLNQIMAHISAFAATVLDDVDAATFRSTIGAQAALGFTPYNATNPSGYISGITSGNVITALGFTPYNASNPSGYITAAVTNGTAVTTNTGTAFDFTGVPSTVNCVKVMLSAVQLTGGTGRIALQLGSGTVQTTGYTSVLMGASSTPAVSNTSFTSGVYGGSSSAAIPRYGVIEFNRVSGNTWVWTGMFYEGTAGLYNFVMGTVTLSGALDRVRLTSSTTDTFSGGTANISWS